MKIKLIVAKITERFKYFLHHLKLSRPVGVLVLGMAGLLLYNWWILVPLKPGLMHSPNELFSDLEVTGQPFATAMQHADLMSGVLILAALLLVGCQRKRPEFREWVAMLVFAGAVIIGGIFPEACPDGISAACRTLEWSFQLPLHHYLHIIAGIFEFGGITFALAFAYRRTKGLKTFRAKIYHRLGRGAFVAYPILGLAYIVNIFGSLIEAVFFVSFAIIVMAQLFDLIVAQNSATKKLDN
jgi:hypothetical protein